MKKKFYLTAIVSLVIFSCSKDEPLATNQGSAIDFYTSMDSRVVSTTTDNLQEFYVTAVKEDNNSYFEKIKFSKNGGVFTSSPSYYWIPGNINFFAYAPADNTTGKYTVTLNSSKKSIDNLEIDEDIDKHIDIIYANATGNKSSNEANGVALTFNHVLSQIYVTAVAANNNYVYKVRGVRIGQPVSSGSYDFITKLWNTSSGIKKNHSCQYAESRALTSNAFSLMKILGVDSENNTIYSNAMLIPQQLAGWDPSTDKTNNKKGAYIALLINITTKDGLRVYPASSNTSGYDWVAVPISTNWEAGKRYMYTLDFSNGAGYVDPEKTEPGTGSDDPFNPGDKVLGAIKFTETVSNWGYSNSNTVSGQTP